MELPINHATYACRIILITKPITFTLHWNCLNKWVYWLRKHKPLQHSNPFLCLEYLIWIFQARSGNWNSELKRRQSWFSLIFVTKNICILNFSYERKSFNFVPFYSIKEARWDIVNYVKMAGNLSLPLL